MLQQTQVATVIPYFERFMARFPVLDALAEAGLDDVLKLWSGLGYYSRARNLHAAARRIQDEYNGDFPRDIEALVALPGIGQSTAGAILAQAFGQRQPILDGNVKRVLARYHAVDGWPGQPAVEKVLWAYAERYTPHTRLDDYTQAVMDLGSLVCTRSRPICCECPLQDDCAAFRQQRVLTLPAKKPRKTLPIKTRFMLLMVDDNGRVLLEKRPPVGIWGGLWSLPEMERDESIATDIRRRWGLESENSTYWPILRHTFSHFHLEIQPIVINISNSHHTVMEPQRYLWYKAGLDNNFPGGLAAPVQRLLDQLRDSIGV
jgi:A/G-specific adenine glycosylase